MFREMRRKEKALTQVEVENILSNSEYGFISTLGENGYPCIVPISYVYYKNSIFFHCAAEGQKLDNIKQNDKVSFSIATDTKVLPERFSTKYRSVVIYGRASEVEGELKDEALTELIHKYSKDFYEEGLKYIEKAKHKTKVVRINIENMTGKSNFD